MYDDAPTACGRALLEIRDLTVEARSIRGASPILKSIDLTLSCGEVLGLVGESGAGKSTLGLAALGYFRSGCEPCGGTIHFDGQDLLGMSEAKRRRLRGSRIAYVAQSAMASFNPAKRLIDQVIRAPLRMGVSREAARSKAVDLFRAMQLPDPDTFGERYPHQASGGQLQRAMVAMALITDPEIIIFDEPTTALDVTTQVEVLASIRAAIREKGTAALYITHDLSVVAQVAHRVMVLRHGAAVEVATIRDILTTPRHPYTQSLWAVRALQHEEKSGGAPVLTIEGVDACYGAIPVLHDITLQVHKGQTVALVGESGSGKSTLGRVIAGLLPPSRGNLQFQSSALADRLSRRSPAELQKIQLIYQSADTALNPRHRVRKIIGRPLQRFMGLRGAALEARIIELLEMIELDASHIDRFPAQLSGGQRQRIAIARALAVEPELIICDEITSALDQVVQCDVLKVLKHLQQRLGLSYFFITHDLEVVRAIADQIVVMQHGRIVDQGSKTEVLSPPYPAYTEKLLASVPEMDPSWLDRHLTTRVAA